MLKFFNRRFFILFIFPIFLGGLSVLSFQPFNFFFVNFLSLTLLFLLIIYVKKKSKSIYRKKPFLKNLFFLGSSYGFGFFFFGLYWIANSLTFDSSFKFLIPFALILIPLFLSLFFSIPIIFAGNFIDKNISSIFLISLFFSIGDFLRSTMLTGFPWNLWAYSFSWSQESLQILSKIGTFSFNLIVITFFFSLAVLFTKNKSKYFFISLIFLIAVSNYFYGSYAINSKKYEENIKKINFKIASASIELSDFKNPKEVASKLIKFSEPSKEKATIFIWPEGIFLNQEFNKKEIKSLFRENFSDNHLIVFGANTTKKENKKEKKYFNSMLVVDRDLNIISQYDKKKLVPFGEFLPFEKYLELVGLNKVVTGYSSFSEGKNSSSLQIKFEKQNINFLPLICYEIIFQELVEKNKDKFDFIINISEDAWFGHSIGPHQHFAKGIFRSIESRSYIIRSANKGISAFISPNGTVLKSLEADESGNIEMQLPILEKNDSDQTKKSLIFLSLLITYIFTFFILRKLKI